MFDENLNVNVVVNLDDYLVIKSKKTTLYTVFLTTKFIMTFFIMNDFVDISKNDFMIWIIFILL